MDNLYVGFSGDIIKNKGPIYQITVGRSRYFCVGSKWPETKVHWHYCTESNVPFWILNRPHVCARDLPFLVEAAEAQSPLSAVYFTFFTKCVGIDRGERNKKWNREYQQIKVQCFPNSGLWLSGVFNRLQLIPLGWSCWLDTITWLHNGLG